MKKIFYIAIALLLSNQAGAHITREIILKQGTTDTKIPASDFKVACVQDNFWGESDLYLKWKMPLGLTTSEFKIFNKHNLVPGACDGQLKDIKTLKAQEGEVNVSLSYFTKFSVVIWADTCSLSRVEGVTTKIRNSEYEFFAGDSTLIAQLTPEKCMSISENWVRSSK